MDQLKEKWQITEGLSFAIETFGMKPHDEIVIQVECGTRFNKTEICQHLVDCHNACRGLDRPDLIPELVQLCQDILNGDSGLMNLDKLLAQIRGE